jgi:DNA-binding SARP family transcriptional activator
VHRPSFVAVACFRHCARPTFHFSYSAGKYPVTLFDTVSGQRLIRLLGPVDLVVGGEVMPLPGGRGRSLLVRLALERGKTVDAERLVDAVWDGRPPRSPAAALHVAVSRVRSVVGEEVVETMSGGYRLRHCSVDLDGFDEAVGRARHRRRAGGHADAAALYRTALAMWRGNALSGCARVEFVDTVARALEEQRITVTEEMIEAELDCGRHEAVVGDLVGLVERHPYRERLWGQLMLALYRGGRQAEALAAFRRYRNRLGEDLGLEPSAGLTELEDQILVGDPSLAPPLRVDAGTGGEELRLAAGELVFTQGDPSDVIYWIEEGAVEIYDESRPREPIARLGPGRYFGELGPLLGVPRSASVRVTADAVLDVMTVLEFRRRFGSG